jgi:hypothetical protein
MWEPRRLTTVRASTTCYRDNFTFTLNYTWTLLRHNARALQCCSLLEIQVLRVKWCDTARVPYIFASDISSKQILGTTITLLHALSYVQFRSEETWVESPNCCWHSPGQWLLVPSPRGLIDTFSLSDVCGRLETHFRSGHRSLYALHLTWHSNHREDRMERYMRDFSIRGDMYFECREIIWMDMHMFVVQKIYIYVLNIIFDMLTRQTTSGAFCVLCYVFRLYNGKSRHLQFFAICSFSCS